MFTQMRNVDLCYKPEVAPKVLQLQGGPNSKLLFSELGYCGSDSNFRKFDVNHLERNNLTSFVYEMIIASSFFPMITILNFY